MPECFAHTFEHAECTTHSDDYLYGLLSFDFAPRNAGVSRFHYGNAPWLGRWDSCSGVTGGFPFSHATDLFILGDRQTSDRSFHHTPVSGE